MAIPFGDGRAGRRLRLADRHHNSMNGSLRSPRNRQGPGRICAGCHRPSCRTEFYRASWQDPAATYNANVLGTIHLVEAARAASQAASLHRYRLQRRIRRADRQRLIDESSPLEPNNPYGSLQAGRGGIRACCMAPLWTRRRGIRPFFLVGPRKTGDVCSDFARRIVAIERGGRRLCKWEICVQYGI